MIILQFLLIYLFVGFIFGIAITWAIGKIEQYKIKDYHDKFKLFMVLFYIILWPYCFVMSIRVVLEARRMTYEQFKNEVMERIDIITELNDVFEEDP